MGLYELTVRSMVQESDKKQTGLWNDEIYLVEVHWLDQTSIVIR